MTGIELLLVYTVSQCELGKDAPFFLGWYNSGQDAESCILMLPFPRQRALGSTQTVQLFAVILCSSQILSISIVNK